jgi:hypothetical protein
LIRLCCWRTGPGHVMFSSSKMHMLAPTALSKCHKLKYIITPPPIYILKLHSLLVYNDIK